MASITTCNLDEDVKYRLRVRAAEHGRSMQEEAREILRHSVASKDERLEASLWQTVRSVIEPLGGMELQLPERDSPHDTPRFDD